MLSSPTNRWGTRIANRRRPNGEISVYHDTDTGPHQFNVVVLRGALEIGSGSLACAIDNSEVIGNRDAVVELTAAEVDWLIDIQEKYDV